MQRGNETSERKERKCIEIDRVRPEFKDLTSELECPICFGLVYDPICCKTCNSPYGKTCLLGWFQSNKTNLCPISKCKFEAENMPKIFTKLISKIKLKCINADCKEAINYDNYYNHLENCPTSQFKCYGLGCTYKGNRQDIISHLEICDKIYEVCKYCKGRFKKENFAAHQANKDDCFNRIMLENQKLIIELESLRNISQDRSLVSDIRHMEKINFESSPLLKDNEGILSNNVANKTIVISEDFFGKVRSIESKGSDKVTECNAKIFSDITPIKKPNNILDSQDENLFISLNLNKEQVEKNLEENREKESKPSTAGKSWLLGFNKKKQPLSPEPVTKTKVKSENENKNLIAETNPNYADTPLPERSDEIYLKEEEMPKIPVKKSKLSQKLLNYYGNDEVKKGTNDQLQISTFQKEDKSIVEERKVDFSVNLSIAIKNKEKYRKDTTATNRSKLSKNEMELVSPSKKVSNLALKMLRNDTSPINPEPVVVKKSKNFDKLEAFEEVHELSRMDLKISVEKESARGVKRK